MPLSSPFRSGAPCFQRPWGVPSASSSTLERPTDREAYNKFSPFFSVVLDGRAFFEHYGTELTFLEKE